MKRPRQYSDIIACLLLCSLGPISVTPAHALGSPGGHAHVPKRPLAAPAGPISFLNDVEPILTRAGCNQGACHGSQFGKGGFKLSLAAYDPQFDHDSIVRQGKGRRIAALAPEDSLLLRKATLALPHMGGLRIARTSGDYEAIAAWIREGAPGPDARDPHVTALVVAPERSVVRPDQRIQLSVRARYSDGTVRDVTAHARIDPLDDRIAAATPEGLVTAHDRGATAIMVRYDGLATVSRVAVPYENAGSTAGKLPASQHFRSFVDRYVAEQWSALHLEPSGPCTDAEFIRRASLDIVGTLPTQQEVQAFEADRVPEKDARLVDRLLARPEYADFWAVKWGDLLRNNRAALGDKAMWSFRNWIRESLLHNRPYDRFVASLITAQGGAFVQPSANYYRVARAPQELAEGVAQVFLGIRLQCAKCHHHPFEKWTQNDYYQFAAFFARVGEKESREPGSAAMEPTVHVLMAGEVMHPKTGARMAPTPLALQDGPAEPARGTDGDASGDRRRLLADWLTSPENKQFARMIVNRYWGYFLGRGIVQPVDDMRVTNPPSNPDLLDALARDFIAHGYDLKSLIRRICTSRAYRLSSHATKRNLADEVCYSHFLQRRQPAEVLLDSIGTATGTFEKFPGLPLGTRAIQLPDALVASPFLDTFGRPPRSTSCECERGGDPSLSQALQMLNGDLVNRKVADPGGRIAMLIASGKTNAQIVESLYYAALSRGPRRTERALAERALSSAVSRSLAAQDLLWALINTKEFAAIR